MNATLLQTGWLARRSVLRTLRRPAAFFPAVAYPVLLLTLFSGGLDLSTRLHGFPTGSYFSFLLAGGFVQAALVGGVNSGVDLATDIQTGFLGRLLTAPMNRGLIVAAQLCGSAALAVVQAAVCLLVGLAAGVRPAGGAGGALVIVALTMTMSLAFSSCGALLALRTRSSEAVLATFPLTFVLLLFSSFFMPRPLMEAHWFRSLATGNPVSYLIEAVRSLLIGGDTAHAVATGFAVAAVLAAAGLGLTTLALRSRTVMA
ncbi:ABC transporter permease [Actinomadura napierensis]|uniref:Transport permease protein n=1 Tax=Actinomadura napierensis TaxID=267854 RepID=A0ABN2ZY61_9ACTN